MNIDECYAQFIKFSEMANNATDDADVARFTKLKGIYLNKFNDLEKKRVADRYDKLKTRIAKHGETYEVWLQWANTLYTITPEFKVISNAVEWKEERSWDCGTEIDCLEKIEQLIGYKEFDRKRGRGDINKDLTK